MSGTRAAPGYSQNPTRLALFPTEADTEAWLHCFIAFWAHKLLAARDYLSPSNYFIIILDT